MEHIQKKPPILATLGIGLAGAISSIFPLPLFVLPGLATYLLLAGGTLHYLAALLLSGALAYVFAGLNGLWALAFLLPISLILAFLLRRRQPYFDICLILSSLAAVALYLVLGLHDALAGTKAFYSIQHFFLNTWETYVDQAVAMSDMLSAAQIDLMRATGRQFAALLPIYMPMAIVVIGALAGLLNTLVCGRLCLRSHVGVKRMRPFYDWALPKSFVRGILLLGAGLLIAWLIGVSSMDSILIAVTGLILIPFLIQGLSFLVFLLRIRRRSGSGLFITAFLLLTVFAPLIVVLSLTVLGVFEQFAHLRRRMRIQQSNKPD